MITDREREFVNNWRQQMDKGVVLPVATAAAKIASVVLGVLLYIGIHGYDIGRQYWDTPKTQPQP